MFKVNQELKNMFILYFIGLTYATLLVIYREVFNLKIPLKKKVFFPNCNGWCISHYLHYLFLGYFAPSYWWLLIIVGFLFEILELYVNKFTSNVTSKIIPDTITNAIGVFSGLLLRKVL